MKRIFTYRSYKKYLKDLIETMGRGAVAKLAMAAGCNRTYISQCLTTKVNLIPDHCLGIGDYLHLKEEEQDYFLLLLLFERSITREAKSKIRLKMDKMVQADLILSKKIGAKSDSKELSELQKNQYYSNWKMAVIHTLTSIKEFQSVHALSKKLRLREIEVNNLLQELTKMGLVEYHDGNWIHTGKNIHVPTGSTYTIQNHLNWRLKSIEDVNNKSSVHYTSLFSLSKRDWEVLREELLEFIEKQRDFIHSSGSEELYCFCCDIFQPLD